MNKRNLFIAILVVIAVVIIVLVAVYAHPAAAPTAPAGGESALSSSSTAPSSTPTSTSTATAPATSSVKSFANGSFSFDYPSSWTIMQRSPFFLDNFGGQYPANAVLPPGGAELSIVTTTAYGGYGVIMQEQLSNATNLSTSTVSVAGVSCAKAKYQYVHSATETLDDTALFCAKGTELWEITFGYNNGDPAAAAHEAVFENILGSMKLIP